MTDTTTHTAENKNQKPAATFLKASSKNPTPEEMLRLNFKEFTKFANPRGINEEDIFECLAKKHLFELAVFWFFLKENGGFIYTLDELNELAEDYWLIPTDALTVATRLSKKMVTCADNCKKFNAEVYRQTLIDNGLIEEFKFRGDTYVIVNEWLMSTHYYCKQNFMPMVYVSPEDERAKKIIQKDFPEFCEYISFENVSAERLLKILTHDFGYPDRREDLDLAACYYHITKGALEAGLSNLKSSIVVSFIYRGDFYSLAISEYCQIMNKDVTMITRAEVNAFIEENMCLDEYDMFNFRGLVYTIKTS